MANQLVYTSSPRGLKPGAVGFCVVACTRGMKEQTTVALEALSGYRRVYADPQSAARNPVAYSHVLYDTGAGRLRILARVADAGLDYSERSNKLACFLDVAPSELVTPGPAALFSQPGLFTTNWTASDSPRYYEVPTPLPNVVAIPGGLDGWRRTTGDPRWAYVLAATVAQRRQVTLVARPDQNVLELFQESLALLPPDERWNATFSTYYMKTPPGVTCQWKAVMQGSPEETTLRSLPGTLLIDLATPGALSDVDALAAAPEVRALMAKNPDRASSAANPFDVPKPGAAPIPTPVNLPNAAPIHTPTALPGAAPVPTGAPTPYDLQAQKVDVPKTGRKSLNYGRDAVLKVAAPKQRRTRKETSVTKICIYLGMAIVLAGVAVAVVIVFANGKGEDTNKPSASPAGGASINVTSDDDGSKPASESGADGTKAAPESGADGSKAAPKSGDDVKKANAKPAEAPERSSESDDSVKEDATNAEKDATDEETNKVNAEKASRKDDSQPNSENDTKENVDPEEIAKKVDENLDQFSQTGDRSFYDAANKLVEAYRDIEKENRVLERAHERFRSFRDAVSSNSFSQIAWKPGDVRTQGPKRPWSLDTHLYSRLAQFFELFPKGRVVFQFKIKNESAKEVCITKGNLRGVDAQEFNVVPLELKETKGEFVVDLKNEKFLLSLPSLDVIRSLRLQVEAFANEKSKEPLFSTKGYLPLLDCYKQQEDKSIDLTLLFDGELPNIRNDVSVADSLILEYAPADEKKDPYKFENDAEERRAVNKNTKTSVVLRYKDPKNNEKYALVFDFKKSKTAIEFKSVKASKHKFDIDFESNSNKAKEEWIECDLKEAGIEKKRLFSFNVRYSSAKDQPVKETPILGRIDVWVDPGESD